MSKLPISALPLPPPALLLNHKLNPDPNTGLSVPEFRQVLKTRPSIQRRARLLPAESHFSYVTPFPIEFPYAIEVPEPSDEPPQNKESYIEDWLSDREAIHPVEHGSAKEDLTKYIAKKRDESVELIGLSETGLRDCLPLLDVGDAFTLLGTPTVVDSAAEEAQPEESPLESAAKARQELIDVVSGHTVLMSDSPEFSPWSLRYSGHQFGDWAGQLGDGRAITILVSPHPSDPENLTYELQLKGGGRTPFSRSADGLAVLRSSIREFLCSEAMHALGIPSSRCLSIVSLPDLKVARERLETASIVSRIAPSFLRIGSFEALNGPANMMFFGGGQQDSNWDALRILGEWVSSKVLRLDIKEGDAWGKELVLDVARRNAKMVAGWQVYGFMHGVINTDNVSVLGLTIDYGPYAFMDVYDPLHICNHTDQGGRYAYKFQPSMIVYAVRALLNSLAPLIGAEASQDGKAVLQGWADNKSDDEIGDWRKKGLALVADEVEREVQQVMAVEYGRLMRKRLALRRQDSNDEAELSRPLLNLMAEQKLDFHLTFRTLTTFKPSSDFEAVIPQILVNSQAKGLNQADATKQWTAWLQTFKDRILSERELWGEDQDSEREVEGKQANPRFVLRQWVLEETISRVESDHDTGKRFLAKVLHMACNPFENWGAEGEDRELDDEEAAERRLCGVGAKKMLGFQCSCSS